MHPIPPLSSSNQVLWYIAFTESTSKFLPTVRSKPFPMSHDIIHQVDDVAPFDDSTVVYEFSTLVPMHGRFSFYPFQEVFGFPFVSRGNRSDDFVILDGFGFLWRGRGPEMVVIFQITLQDLIVLSDFFIVTEIRSVQNSPHVIV